MSWLKAEDISGFFGVERAVFSVESEAATIDGGLDAEGAKNEFAEVGEGEERFAR